MARTMEGRSSGSPRRPLIFNRYKEADLEAPEQPVPELSVGAAGQTSYGAADFKGEFKLGDGQYCLSPRRHRPHFPLPAPLRSNRVRSREDTVQSSPPSSDCSLEARPAVHHPAPTTAYHSQVQCAVSTCPSSVWWLHLGIAIERMRARPSTTETNIIEPCIDLGGGTNQAARHEQLATTARFDAFVRRVRRRAAARGTRDENACAGVSTFAAALH